jgi:hypothetical protein
MKKVGIVTVYGEQNFGNKLQNYALIQIYKELGFDPVTLQVRQSALKLSSRQKAKNVIKAMMALTPTKSPHAQYYRRKQSFRAFSQKYLNLSEAFYTDNANKAFLDSFDILSVGSDQVWNDVDFDINDVKYFSLANVKGPKKISFAASIGKSDFQEKYKKSFVQGLSDFDFISCRENIAVEYLSEILKRKCYLIMDPTLFLSADQWEAIEKRPEWLDNKRYCLLYFLGGYDKTLQNNLPDNILSIDLMLAEDTAYVSSPEEFIYLIHHAVSVFTDSFHACVFSMIFHKNFTVFNRKNAMCNMNSRIDTLFQEFSVEGKIGKLICEEDYQDFKRTAEQKKSTYENLIMSHIEK